MKIPRPQIKNVFPNDLEIERINTVTKYTNLYENKQEVALPLHDILQRQFTKSSEKVYIAHAIPAKISDFYGDFVQGDLDLMTIDTTGEDENEKKTVKEIIAVNDLKEAIYDYAVDQSIYGYEVLLGRVEDGKFIIEAPDKDQYFPQKDGSVIFASYIRDPHATMTALDKRQKYLYTQHYFEENGNVMIERKAWQLDTSGRARDEVGISVIGLEQSQALEKIEGLDELPIVQIDNGKRNRYGFGKSDYADIMPQLAEVNERSTHNAMQFLKNMDAIMELAKDESHVDKDGRLKKIEYIMLPSKDHPQTRFVTNENPLIDLSFQHIDKELRFISLFSGVPMWALLDQSMPERVESMRIKLFDAIRKTDTKRARLERGVLKLIKIGAKMLKREIKSDLYIDFSDVLPVDTRSLAETEDVKVRGGFSSKKSAMMRIENYSDEEAEAEMKQIRDEEIVSGAVNPANAPTL